MEPRLSPFVKAEFQAEALVEELFSSHGWKLQKNLELGSLEPDFLALKGRKSLIIEVKAFAEGRPDRVLPLLSHAIVQARAYARAHGAARPLAILFVSNASPSLVNRIEDFAGAFADGVAIGLISDNGLRHFIGEGLEALNHKPGRPESRSPKSVSRIGHLFSDLNQWMLKVLLAPEIPDRLLSAPRAPYRNASELAQAANVSVMSAFRFVRQLKDEGYLDESAQHLRLVRRADLFRRWQASNLRASPNEVRVVFLLGGSIEQHLSQLQSHDACLALFAAADALGLGHVSGVPPHIYGPKWSRLDPKVWPVFPAADKPDFILREASAPKSVFRGAVRPRGVPVCDVIQIWLDVSRHPSRGAEQADLIYRQVLSRVVEQARA